VNNGGGPRIPLASSEDRPDLLPTGLAGFSCSGSPAGEIHHAINAWRLLDWVFSVVRTHVFYLTIWFQRECFEALLTVNFMELVFFPWSWRRRS
jgi:hypothetical protein